jgi:large subunit ribosomal protein L25
MQRDGVTGEVLHIDFHAIALTEQVRVKIPIVLNGEPLGVKQDGGVLEHFLREVEVECLPTQIPKQVEFDISPMAVGQTVHVKDLTPPAGSKFTTDLDAPVASVLAPKIETPAEAVPEAAAEPEVIREKKPEEGEASEAGKEAGKKEEKPKAARPPGPPSARAGEAKEEKKEK